MHNPCLQVCFWCLFHFISFPLKPHEEAHACFDSYVREGAKILSMIKFKKLTIRHIRAEL